MKILDTSSPRVIAVAVGAVIALSQNAQGTNDALTIASQVSTPTLTASNAHITPYVPSRGQYNQLNPSLTPATLTLAGVVAGDVVTIFGTKFTCVASGAVGAQFNVGGTDAISATNLATVITSYYAGGTAPGAGFRTSDQTVAFGITVSEPTGLVAVAATGLIEASFDNMNWTPISGLSNPCFNNVNGTGIATSMTANVGGVPFVRARLTAISGTGAVAIVNLHGINSKSS